MTAASIYQCLSEIADDLDKEYSELEDTTVEQMVILMAAIRDCRQDLASLYDRIEQDLLFLTKARRMVVEGLGEVEITKKTTYKEWDNERLTQVVVARALDERRIDDETGEAEPGWEVVARVLSECSRPNWRLTPLRARGIDESEFCTVVEGDRAVKLPSRQR